MPIVYYGRKDESSFVLEHSRDLIAVRTRSRRSITRSVGPVPTPLATELNDGNLVAAYPEAGVEVYRVPTGRGKRSVSKRKAALRGDPDVRFAGGVLIDPATREPILYTENLFIKFVDTANPDDCIENLRHAGLTVKSQVTYAANAYFVAAQEGTGEKVFDIAVELLQREDVEYCHPELIRPVARKGIYPQQWHLKETVYNGVSVSAHANVEAAQDITRGEGVCIAVIDDGVDIDHPEFLGADKIKAPRDATLQTSDPRPKDSHPWYPDDHGTACAGVACANGTDAASGVAPDARLMPIRLVSGLGSQREAEAITWAVDNGADIISCSWGPPDGKWWDPGDQSTDLNYPLPAHTRLAIENAVTNGRGGRGCVIFFAAGNGNESMNTDQYASNPNVIAVAACNDRGKRAVYSDFGDAVWCAFPSGDASWPQGNHPAPLTSGIWTTDRRGLSGYNPGDVADGDAAGNYTNSFGGTSSSCPGAAGVAALVLSQNPDLKWHEVKDLFKRACDKIDPQGGDYGADGHSQKYGYGRLNALTAIELAKPQAHSGVTVIRYFDAPIPDLQTVSFELTVPDDTVVERVTASVDLKHTYIGDLVITLHPPSETGVSPVLLHDRFGGAKKDLKRTYDAVSTPQLGAFTDKNCSGIWALKITDSAAQDIGTLVSFGISLWFTHPNRADRIT